MRYYLPALFLLSIILGCSQNLGKQSPLSDSGGIVRIKVRWGNITSYGSGVVIRERGRDLLLTAYHLFPKKGKQRLVIESASGKKIPVKLGRIWRLKSLDTIAIELINLPEGVGRRKVGYGTIGERIEAVGFPRGGTIRTTKGIIQHITAQNSCNIEVGMSGGPILNREGEVIGIISSKILSSDGSVSGEHNMMRDILPKILHCNSSKEGEIDKGDHTLDNAKSLISEP